MASSLHPSPAAQSRMQKWTEADFETLLVEEDKLQMVATMAATPTNEDAPKLVVHRRNSTGASTNQSSTTESKMSTSGQLDDLNSSFYQLTFAPSDDEDDMGMATVDDRNVGLEFIASWGVVNSKTRLDFA
jgi:hypothetical protein